MALFMNQILPYRISAEGKGNIYKENKTPNQTVHEPGQNGLIYVS